MEPDSEFDAEQDRKSLRLVGLAVLGMIAGCRVHVDKGANGEHKNVQVDTPFGGVHVNTNQTTAVDLGLPAYPGSQTVSDDDKHKSADVHMGFGERELRVRTVSYVCAVPEKGNVLSDQIVSLPALDNGGEEPILFRRIEYWNPDKQEILVFFTNVLHLAASTVAAIYKDRWQIELFFKALKQTAKAKSFLGASAIAVKTQIWTALIAMLILKYLQIKFSFGWSLSNLAALLRQQLFIFRDLRAWLNNPLEGPPAARQLAEQLPMPPIW